MRLAGLGEYPRTGTDSRKRADYAAAPCHTGPSPPGWKPMSLRRASLSVALFALGLLSACALRPHYSELAQPEGSSQKAVEGQTLMMRMVDPATGQPIKGAKVLSG